jgi:excisionase family DNA binding protein
MDRRKVGAVAEKKSKTESASRTGKKDESGAHRSDVPYLASEGQIPAGEQLLDPKEVGKRLGLSPRTVSEMANAGRLPAYRIGIYLRFKWAEVETHLAATCKVRAALASDSKNISTPHPAPMTRSRPLARPDGPSTARIPSAASQATEVPDRGGEGMKLRRAT